MPQTLAEITLSNGIVQKPSWSSLKDYWPDVNSTQIECATTSHAGSFAVFSFTIASGQEGIIAVWNVVEYRWQHISSASYVISALLIEKINAIVSLHYVQYWGVTAHHVIRIRPLDNTKNFSAEISLQLRLPPKSEVIEISEQEVRAYSQSASGSNSGATAGLFLMTDDITIIAQDADDSYRFSIEDVQGNL